MEAKLILRCVCEARVLEWCGFDLEDIQLESVTVLSDLFETSSNYVPIFKVLVCEL